MTTVLISVLAILVVVLGFTTFNLMRKVEKQEDVLANYLIYLDRLSRTIEISDKKLKELDRGGVFQADDEVGQIFKSIVQIQDILNEFNLRKLS